MLPILGGEGQAGVQGRTACCKTMPNPWFNPPVSVGTELRGPALLPSPGPLCNMSLRHPRCMHEPAMLAECRSRTRGPWTMAMSIRDALSSVAPPLSAWRCGMHACFRPAGDGRRLTATPVIGLEKMVRLPVLIVECRSSPTQTQVLSFGRPVLHSSVMCRQCSFSLVGCTPG